MYPWLFPWMGLKNGPLSGDVQQAIATSWLSPHVEFNLAGDRRIEADIITDVASYGRQLGIISEAVLELAGKKKGNSIDRLEKIVADIEDVKKCHKERREKRLRAELDQWEKDKEELSIILKEYLPSN